MFRINNQAGGDGLDHNNKESKVDGETIQKKHPWEVRLALSYIFVCYMDANELFTNMNNAYKKGGSILLSLPK